ncbi:hypothetical protein [Posidoniimonas polymericola]|uniref:hypothetical protein n=1 Tax=Posidoniimonas polymericola TaxID=2528002 RepID=UPI0011B472E0|nr:hypothetical protein [Posidoniimonas polymericola]
MALLPIAAFAGPLDQLRRASGAREAQETRPRRANDDLEGTVWEYTAEYDGHVKEGEAKPKDRTGRFRTEGEAVFEVGRRLTAPNAGGGLRARAQALQQSTGEVPLPTTQVKRIGEYRRNKEKLIIDFDDEDSLHGVMVLRRKKDTRTVWHGDYREKEGKRVVSEWKVEVRKIED